MAAALGRLDAIVFTAGIGEHGVVRTTSATVGNGQQRADIVNVLDDQVGRDRHLGLGVLAA